MDVEEETGFGPVTALEPSRRELAKSSVRVRRPAVARSEEVTL